MTDPALLSVREAATLLRVPEATVYRLAATHQIAVVRERPGARIRFLRADVEAWVERHRIPVASAPRRVTADTLPGAERYR